MDKFSEELCGAILQASRSLPARHQIVVGARLLGERKRTLKDLANQFGVSTQRVTEIELNARRRIARYFRTDEDSILAQEAAKRGWDVSELLTPCNYPLSAIEVIDIK
ncbi:hypothetical protein CCAX7_46680 [Capsulimonas corticalis]|uniref:Uncharacterized protein n=1 Tax=Capsulimonas corticalis TaxID=2219043 RepID=A0A402CQD3_9BACT|nr:sigma factor-like helix-turn-helix DNA-binding protein [Capsulimonas corticalis]BDI32617.1 hypothetical protein CCAX7_46680 [Capsulimonas corticalis]